MKENGKEIGRKEGSEKCHKMRKYLHFQFRKDREKRINISSKDGLGIRMPHRMKVSGTRIEREVKINSVYVSSLVQVSNNLYICSPCLQNFLSISSTTLFFHEMEKKKGIGRRRLTCENHHILCEQL